MPADALPIPPTDTTGTVTWTRSYEDAAKRPLSGTVTLTRAASPAISVVADLVGGSASFRVVPGTYRLSANLRTIDGSKVYDFDTVEIPRFTDHEPG